MKLQKTKRHQVKLRIGLSGASGFGKSYSALLLAYGITGNWDKIAIIDTENGSASLYSHLGNFNVLQVNEPFSPERYIEAIQVCEKEGMEVIVIDSISHEWNGKGGCLQLHEQLGGKFQDWGKITPRHQAFVNAILQSNSHIITTVRRKIDYSLDSNSNGRTKVVKHGTKEVTREGFEYELTVNFEIINDKHLAKSSKDRTGLFSDKPEFIINSNTGKKLLAWCNEGISIESIEKEIDSCTTIEGLKHLYSKYATVQEVIKPIILSKKEEIELLKEQLIQQNIIVEPNKKEKNGINN